MTDKQKPLRIIGLQVENVKCLKAISLNTNRTLIKVEGKNEAGKSAVLDAIMYAFGGGRVLPDVPIRKGETKARVVIDLDEITIERRWTLKTTNLVVTTKDGAQLGSPQAVLEKLFSDRMFDPLEFADRMTPQQQADTLKKLAGLDFTELDEKRTELYNERTIVNREALTAKANVGEVIVKPKSMTPVSVSEMAAKQQEAVAHNLAIDDLQRDTVRLQTIVDGYTEDIATLQQSLQMHETQIKDNQAKLKPMTKVDEHAFIDQMASTESDNKQIEAYSQYESARTTAKAKADESDSLTKQIETIDDDKAKMLREAKFPLEGLDVDESGPTLDGLPFSQACLSKRLRVGVAIGLAEKKRARIVLIHDGSLLDTDSMKDLNGILDEYDAQCFVEMVAESPSENAVWIVDGEVGETT